MFHEITTKGQVFKKCENNTRHFRLPVRNFQQSTWFRTSSHSCIATSKILLHYSGININSLGNM